MGFDIKVTGGSDLLRVQHRLKQVADTGLGKQMGRALREAAKPLQPAVKAEAVKAMPSGYGPTLSRSLRFRTAVKQSAHSADVLVRVYGDGRRKRRDVPRLNKGRLRHPLFGRRAHWYDQRVRSGFVDRPADRLMPQAAAKMQSVIDYVAEQIGA